MTLKGAGHHLRALLGRNAPLRRQTLHLLVMLCRGFDLSGVGVEELGLTQEKAFRYGNSGGPDLDKVLKTLPISRADAALDVGCGKGGAMLTLAKYPFARVDGIEISAPLARIAERHLVRAGIRNASVFCCDAAEFHGYDQYTHLYMYNPFPENVLRSALDNMLASLKRRPRTLTLIYYNPVYHELVVAAGFSYVQQFTHGHLVFRTYVIGGH